MPADTWTNISIDLQCFVDEGIDFTGLVVPFELGSSGKASLSVADIQFTPNAAESASISCQE
jgi:beta-glucosidase